MEDNGKRSKRLWGESGKVRGAPAPGTATKEGEGGGDGDGHEGGDNGGAGMGGAAQLQSSRVATEAVGESWRCWPLRTNWGWGPLTVCVSMRAESTTGIVVLSWEKTNATRTWGTARTGGWSGWVAEVWPIWCSGSCCYARGRCAWAGVPHDRNVLAVQRVMQRKTDKTAQTKETSDQRDDLIASVMIQWPRREEKNIIKQCEMSEKRHNSQIKTRKFLKMNTGRVEDENEKR